jgi:hypothetical protein
MKVTFDTLNEKEVNEVVALLQSFGMVRVDPEPQSPVSVTETASEDANPSPVIPTQPEPVSEAPEPSDAPVKKATRTKKASPKKVTLQEVKDLAKNMVTKTSREDVKKVISEFGEKLTEVKESDYDALVAKLSELA